VYDSGSGDGTIVVVEVYSKKYYEVRKDDEGKHRQVAVRNNCS
jgi:hypothetical protein